MARSQADDRERARESDRRDEVTPEPTEALAVSPGPTEPAPKRRRYGVAADRGQWSPHRVFGGPLGGD
ncbi:MAG: hypothetical protein JNM10_00260 [Planctomycetia bacterium]|nr:hypothetical protein [Planctomycetia bacterium]